MRRGYTRRHEEDDADRSDLRNGCEEDVLALAAAVELASEHPLARAVVDAARTRGLVPVEVEAFRAVTGEGVRGRSGDRNLSLGSRGFLESEGADTRDVEGEASRLRERGRTVAYLAADGRVLGLVAVADPVKASAAEALRSLRAEGLEVVMLTGDDQATASAVARELGIDRVIAGVLPTAKREVVARLQDEGRVVAMAGDGMNDAPALAQAQVGIAMGTGADVAIESAGLTLLKGDLRGIVHARRLSTATVGNIRQNLFLAFLYNVLGVPIAAGVLYPFAGVLLSPMVAAAAMSLSSLSVIANALRLRRAAI